MTGMLLDVASDRGLVVTGRRAARRVLVPRYAELRLRAAAPAGDARADTARRGAAARQVAGAAT
jgi:hypothetical protein